jgi:hypothetical protein
MHRELGRSQRMILTCVILIGLSAFSVLVGSRSFQAKTFDFDLVAFYCGGQVTAAGRDPYRTEPLRTCEHAIGSVFRKGTPAAVPDPLPAYDQALFAALSFLPYRAVQVLWMLVGIGACGLTVYLLADVSSLPLPVVACSLAISDLYCSTILGQLLPLSLLGIALCGWGLERRRGPWVCTGIVLAMSEPHLGLAALVAVLVWGGRFRVSAALAGGVLALVSAAVVPASTLVEYVTSVVPAHALSEINNEEQLSLAYLLHALGLSPDASLSISKIQYATMLALGVLASGRAVKRCGPAVLAFAPVAFVLVGGPFVHVTQMAAALPAALLLAGREKSAPAAAAGTLLSVPWLDFSSVFGVLPIAAGALFVTLRGLWKLGVVRSTIGVAAAVGSIGAAALYVALDGPRRIPAYGVVAASSLAEVTWKTIVDNDRHGHAILFALAKLPTEVGLLTLVCSVACVAFPRRATRASRESKPLVTATLVRAEES